MDRELQPAHHQILSNPETGCPKEILQSIVAIERIQYLDFDGWVQHDGLIEVHCDVQQDTRGFFALAYEIGFPITSIVPASKEPYKWNDDALMAANVSSGFNYRTIAGTERLSPHARGLAIDVNPALNPYITYNFDGTEKKSPSGAMYCPGKPGVFDNDHPLVQFMKEHGWEWGGDFEDMKDYHHFQKLLNRG